MKSPRLTLRRPSLAPALLLSALAQVSCFSEPAPRGKPSTEPEPAAGGAATDSPTAGAAGAAGDAPVPTETVQARLGILHAAEELPQLAWSLTGAASPQDGSLSARQVEQLVALPPGDYTLTLTLDDAEESLELELTSGGEVNVVVSPEARGKHPWRAHVLTGEVAPKSEAEEGEASAAARLFLVNAGRGGVRALDVGTDGVADGEVEPDEASPELPLDVTRPTVAFVDDGGVTDSFTLPQPQLGTTLLAVLLGDPSADGVGPEGQRLLVAQMVEGAEASELRADPVLYLLHASAQHAGLDLFVAPGNPLAATIPNGSARPIDAFLPDITVNKRRNLAEVLDNARFGELRVGRVPPLSATLELYLTIPGDPQVPAALNFNLSGELQPNQRLRNGPAIGRQGAQTVGGELQAGAEYLLVAPSNGLFVSNHTTFGAPKAPNFPFGRLERRPAADGHFSLRVAGSLLTALGTETISVNGTERSSGRPFFPSHAEQLSVGTHEVLLNVTPGNSRKLELDGQAGQDLLVVAAGDTLAPVLAAPAVPRADDADGDGAVCSAMDPETRRFLDPNYLPLDGNSSLIQDDCPAEPGPLLHQGCPATPLQWLIIDLSTRPPTLRAVPMEP